MDNIKGKKVGIWLDHAKAHLMNVDKDVSLSVMLSSGEESNQRFKGESATGTKLGNNKSTNSEYHKHHREIEISNDYYHRLAEYLKNFDEILLFGSSTAKEELFNRLKENKHFDQKIITVLPSDHLTENQMLAKVREHFKL